MANSKKTSGGTAAKIIAILLAILLVVGTLFSVGYYLGWFNKTDDETEQTEEASGGGATLSDGESNGISLTRTIAEARTLAANGQTAESTYTLTATVSPSYATNPELTWSIAWDTSWSGYDSTNYGEDVYSEEWTSDGKTSATEVLSDYVSLSATTGSSVTVSCWQPFGNPIIITVAATDGSGVTATCKVDYQSYVTGINLYPTTDNLSPMSTSSTSTARIYYIVNYSTGTIAANYTVTYNVRTGLDEINSYIYSNGNYYKGKNILKDESEIASGTSTGYTGTLVTYSLNWTTFLKSLIDTDSYTYSESMLADIYTAFSSCGYTTSGTEIYYAYVSVTDNIKGGSYSDSSNYYLNSLSGYPTYAVTNVSLNTNSITF